VSGFTLTAQDLLRVCRDLAWSDIAAMPGARHALGPRTAINPEALSWGADGLALDSLACVQLATAAATWCNAYDAGFEDLFLAKRNAADWADVMRRARAAGAANVTFSSSGSTGAQKHIRHQEDVLANEARAWATVLTRLQPVRRVVCLVPTHHIYGFIWGVLLPHALSAEVCDADMSALPSLSAGDLVVAVPEQWAWLAPSAKSWPAGVLGVSSTAPLPEAVANTLANLPLLQVYGATETAGLAWRSAAGQPYELAPGRRRNAAGGIELQLPSSTWVLLPVQDELRWLNEHSFDLLRRQDDGVQVAGHNVSPRWVSEHLCKHAAVKEACVRLSEDHQPVRLKAFVVLHSEAPLSQRAALEQWLLETLPWYAAPGRINYGTELPRNALGKLCDWPT
jgi:long-chain acyl-CoA synthetase